MIRCISMHARLRHAPAAQDSTAECGLWLQRQRRLKLENRDFIREKNFSKAKKQ